MTSSRISSLRSLAILSLTALALAACQSYERTQPSSQSIAGPTPPGADVNTPDKNAKAGGTNFFAPPYRGN